MNDNNERFDNRKIMIVLIGLIESRSFKLLFKHMTFNLLL